MRVGIVTATYLPSRNGVATSTSLYVSGLRALGHEVYVFAPAHPAQRRRAGETQPGDGHLDGVYRLPSTSWGAPPDYPLMLWPGPLVVARLPVMQVDVFHAMHPFLAGQLASFWSRRMSLLRGVRVPLVFTAHTQYDQYLHYARALPSRRAGRSLMRAHVAAFARQADRVLVPGQAMAQMLGQYGYAGAVGTLPNPVDLPSFAGGDAAGRNAVRARYGVPADAPLIVNVGRQAPEKNLPALLTAFARARETRPELRLLLVGDGPAHARLRALAGEGVQFAGAVPYAQVPSILAAADVFATASGSEVLPMSMIEALAAGLPLVAARSPAALDLIIPGENGLLVDAGAEALADGLLRAAAPGTLKALSAGARASARGYDVRTLSRRLEGIYNEVLNG